jgi:catechol 2,3-dioxygenase
MGTADHGMTHSLYLADPDGNEIELYIDVEGVDWNDPELLMSRPQALRL